MNRTSGRWPLSPRGAAAFSFLVLFVISVAGCRRGARLGDFKRIDEYRDGRVRVPVPPGFFPL